MALFDLGKLGLELVNDIEHGRKGRDDLVKLAEFFVHLLDRAHHLSGASEQRGKQHVAFLERFLLVKNGPEDGFEKGTTLEAVVAPRVAWRGLFVVGPWRFEQLFGHRRNVGRLGWW